MPGIVTLTMNPAIDVSMSTAKIEPVRKLRCDGGRRDPGGGGINVARVASRLGAQTMAVYPIGGFVGQLLKGLLDEEGLTSIPIPVHGQTREDFTVEEDATAQQYRFVLPGQPLYENEWTACLEAVSAISPRPDFVCASGSLPPGVPEDFYARLADVVAGWGAKFVLDTSGAALKAALTSHVYLIKPSLGELRELSGAPLADQNSRVEACRGLINRGAVEVVALSLGADGALLVTANEAWRAAPLAIDPVSTVGAGDSFLGAMVWALASRLSLVEAFRYGVAGGSAALLEPGTTLCRPQMVHLLESDVSIQAISEAGR
jgi:6-phosphofructokinase 2